MYKALYVASFLTNDMRKQNVIKLESNASPVGRHPRGLDRASRKEARWVVGTVTATGPLLSEITTRKQLLNGTAGYP